MTNTAPPPQEDIQKTVVPVKFSPAMNDVEIAIGGVVHYDHGPNVAEALARLHMLDAPTLAKPKPELGCEYRGTHFGAVYPDAQCHEGYLWDEDSCDEPGGPLLKGGDIPCPKCNAKEYAQYQRECGEEQPCDDADRNIAMARTLFEEMALIADEEQCIRMLASALTEAQADATRDEARARIPDLEAIAHAGRPQKLTVRIKHPDNEPTGCSSLLNYHEPTRELLINAGIPLARHTRNPIVSFGMIECRTTDGYIEYTWAKSQDILLDKTIPAADQSRVDAMKDAPKPEVVASLLLGGIDGSEYGDNDIQLDTKAVERLQGERVTTTDDVVVELVTADQYKVDTSALEIRATNLERLAMANKTLADSYQRERDAAVAAMASRRGELPQNWLIERTGERIVIQHQVNGAGYAASRTGASGIAESVLYLLAEDLLKAAATNGKA
ncbi:hypothetical protein ACQCLI_32085 (plasmid) [Pseudomonas nitroreducens]|uniref:hypothetical protein n=1 Tax=Pseudomonas nitroreducens TaxID=46680 RepID=UPI0003737C0B|nr:hypothetical protein [Pseudomonas nitroreducens]